MAVATFDDVSTALGRPISEPSEQDQVEWWLAGAEIVLSSRLGNLTTLDQDVLKYVEVEAVVAKVRRQGTLESSITVAVDDGSVTRRFDSPMTEYDITDEWWRLLGAPRPRAVSMSVGGNWLLR